ncbi:MAG TPA: DUF4402 domain-containing protein [Croceibacterium sp.]|nr:DUF4402 domain-containing protein [Croceibacterium sp.]
MTRAGPALVAAIALVSSAASAAADPACETCAAERPALGVFEQHERPLNIEIESGLQFGRMALSGLGEGAARIDPETGESRVESNMIDLGGATFQGRARVTGEPLRPVRIELPASVLLRSADGAEARLSEFVTDLPPAPMLDANGVLEFAFGARLTSKGARGGDFRGRIRIRVDYF